jgi:hypothetical protein
VRSLENQQECYVVFQQTLRELEIPFAIIQDTIKSLDERVNNVLRLLLTRRNI